MPAERTTMRLVREIVRLHQAGVSTREIAIQVGVAASTVRLTLRRVAAAGMIALKVGDQTFAVSERSGGNVKVSGICVCWLSKTIFSFA